MLKMYHQNGFDGGSAAYWDEAWSDGGFDEALRFCEIDPLRPIFECYTKPGALLLEGGCGRGQYVRYYSARGIKVIGLDFARDALAELRARENLLPLCAGDVAKLPFRDESFDVYYSGGVVEHFEAGAEAALNEAWRVLRPGGTLLISVPYYSPLKKMISLFKTSDRKKVAVPGLDTPEEGKGRRFFQYAYTISEFRTFLEKAGFQIVSIQGYSILWGLYDVPLIESAVSSLTNRSRTRNAGGMNGVQTPVNQSAKTSQPGTPLLKRLVIGEDDSVPLAGLIVRMLRSFCANMMMYVCLRSYPEAPMVHRALNE